MVDFLMRKAHDRHKVDIESILYTFYQMKVGQSIEKKMPL